MYIHQYMTPFHRHTISFFRAEVAMLGSEGIYTGLEEEMAKGLGQSGM
jgi:hypothetical protein